MTEAISLIGYLALVLYGAWLFADFVAEQPIGRITHD